MALLPVLLKKICVFSLVVVIPSFLFAQNSFSGNGLTAPLASPDINVPDRSQWMENIAERTLYSSSYHTADGQVMLSYSKRPINYYNVSGQLVPIDPSLRPSENGWCAADQPYPTYLYADGSTALSLGKNDKIIFNQNCRINGQKIKGTFSANENTFLCRNIIPGISKEYVFHENGIKYNYILNQPVASADASLRISEEITFPEGYQLIRSDPDSYRERGKETNEGWTSELILQAPSGAVVSRFCTPLCYDAGKNYSIASYLLKKENGKQVLEIIVPLSWVNDPSRSFPVVIDPLVIGPTSLWTGGFMPSCIVPAYNADSILVTIPGGITITGLYVTSSYYANPLTTAVMSQGSLKFTTSCGTSQIFTVPNPTGNTPGTAYLDSFNLSSPLMCCFVSACTTRTFYLTMNLGRTGPSTGCNTTYIRYDPTTTLWPFKALVIGRTAEFFGSGWLVPNTPICSNQCSLSGTVYVRYGVPPFTMSHPWATGSVTVGTPSACGPGAQQYNFNMTIPNCPRYCDTATQLAVPPPIVTDACGNSVTGLPTRIVPLKKAPNVTAVPPSLTVCSGNTAFVSLASCISNDTIIWFGNTAWSTGNISNVVSNNGSSASIINYSAYSISNGCFSDTITIPVTVDPLPGVNFTYSVPCIVNMPVNFNDASAIYAGTASGWFWNFGDNSSSLLQNASHVFISPGTYKICHAVVTNHGCTDTLCREITVITADVIAPNVVTPNGDGLNDLLKFKYLEFFPGNKLEIYNRWGNLIYQKFGYLNDWNASGYNSGTYYYVLKVDGLNKTYKGAFEVLF